MQTLRHEIPTLLPIVMLVDDEPAVLSALGRLLRGLPCEVVSARNGAHAVQLLAEHRPRIELVVSDMRMPEMDGLQLLTRVASEYPAIRRILLTGYADLDTTISAINDGHIHYFLEKPWDDQQIRRLIEQELQSQQVARENRRLHAMVKKQNDILLTLNRDLEQKVQARTAHLRQSRQAVVLAKQALEKSFDSTLDMLSKLIATRFTQTDCDEDLLESMTCESGRALGLDEASLRTLRSACRLRNLGRLSLPEELLVKPLAAMSRKEAQRYQTHPLVASGLLRSAPHLAEAAVVVETHKEYLDGSGFPVNLRADDVGLAARILCVVSDLFDYRAGRIVAESLSFIEAFDIMLQQAGKRYDEQVLQAVGDALCRHSATVASEGMRMCCDQLAPGMQVAKDLRTQSGLMLLAKGVRLDDKVIRQLQRLQTNLDEELCVTINLDA